MRNGRDLPWRATRDPYRILVSELMLQQTQVSRVLGFYDRFLTRFPTLGDIARARPGQVREAWRGLGYYARARNLHRLAREISPPNGSGNMPDEPDALRRLPGVGAYTAGAVASFAYERRAALVDTNVARVLRRVFAPRVNPKSSKGQRVLWDLAAALLPRTGKSTWTHNQALMELGALVCTARTMNCGACPVRRYCLTGRGGVTQGGVTQGGVTKGGVTKGGMTKGGMRKGLHPALSHPAVSHPSVSHPAVSHPAVSHPISSADATD